MHITVFGISGRTGRALIDAAEERGIDLVGLVRRRAGVPGASRLRVLEGDLGDLGLVREVVANAQAVICVLGPRPPLRDAFCAAATATILAAMKTGGGGRFLCQTGAMIGALPPNVSRPMQWAARRFAAAHPAVAADRAEQEALVRASPVAWTLVKPPRLSNRRRPRPVAAGPTLSVGLLSSIGRAALAGFMLDEIDGPRFICQAVYVRE
jgi:putative NADH-flavin reductase